MTYGYKNFVIFPFEITNSNNKNSYIEAKIDFLICDDICVPEKALIKTNLDEINSDPSLNDWFLKVPDQILPVKASVDSEYINIRFSSEYALVVPERFTSSAIILKLFPPFILPTVMTVLSKGLVFLLTIV